MKRWQMDRRAFLHGAARTAIALPLLEAMYPSDHAMAQAAPFKRAVFMIFPNGSVGYEMSPTDINVLTGMLEPLAPWRNHLTFVNGLNNKDNATWGKNSSLNTEGGAHEFSDCTFMACRPTAGIGNAPSLGITIDQVIGQHLRSQYNTRLGSLPISDGHNVTGLGQFGVNMLYQSMFSWKSATEYVPALSHPRLVFNELFAGATSSGGTSQELLRLKAQRKSILDVTLDQLTKLRTRVGAADQLRIDRHLTAVRDVEAKVDAISTATLTCTIPSEPSATKPTFPLYTRATLDLMALALQCRTVPVIAYQMSTSNGGVRTAEYAGVTGDQHSVTHGQDLDARRKINAWYNTQFAYLLQKLNEADDLGTPVLRNTLCLLGAGNADAQSHDPGNCPIVIAGGQGLGLTTGRVIDKGLRPKTYGQGTMLADLHLDIAKKFGVPITTFGNSRGTTVL